MRIFLAGSSGVIGTRLVPLLVGAGHVVAGMTRSPARSRRSRRSAPSRSSVMSMTLKLSPPRSRRSNPTP